MKLPLRIAILECDHPPDKAKERLGGYGPIFRTLLESSADSLGQPGLSAEEGLELTYWDVMEEPDKYPNLNDIDAVLLTGSKHNAFDNTPWILKLVEFTKKLLEQDRVRIIGVCFGHQIIGRAMGVPVGRSDLGFEVSVVSLDLSELGKQVFQRNKIVSITGPFAGEKEFLTVLRSSFKSLWQMHRDIVSGFPSGVQDLASTNKCANQGMYEKGRLITVQGHPEFTLEIMEEILNVRYKLGILTQEEYEDGMRRLSDHDDGVVAGQAFLRFLLED